MKVVIPGGTGQIGQVLVRALLARGDDVVVLSRGGRSAARVAHWDGRTLGTWAEEFEGADAVINLAGRSVNCRYTLTHVTEMLRSRVDSTLLVGSAIARCARPPRSWLQMSTATIYAHRFDAANDEETGWIGGAEPDAPRRWDFSVEIAKAWERALFGSKTPATRCVALRSAVMLSADPSTHLDLLLGLVRLGLGGRVSGGRQYVSWIHERDFVRAVEFLLTRPDLEGPINLASPNPLPQREFMAALRDAAGVPIGLPATSWMAEVGAFLLRSDTELLLKSRRVVPGRLCRAGFTFEFATWLDAARDLVARRRARARASLAA
ncbi:MAG TPA: DUF1731 domain-containing protein [Myxococcota bacterium]|nr:DUF1731 domain-containing protein [Myxococcota bacterium]